MLRSRPGKQKSQLRRLRSWTGPISSDSDCLATGLPYERTERTSAHSDAFATQFTSASDKGGHTSRQRSAAVECMGRPRCSRGRALSRGQATARPSPQSVSAHSGHDRSAKNTGSTRYARFHDENNQDWSRCPACMLHHGSRINLYPVERQRLVPKSCILVAAWLQDGWDSSLVRLIRPTRHPQSHIRPGIGPEAWAKTHSTDQVVTMAPVGTLPVSTYRQRAITSLRASAMIMMRRTRPLRSPTRL